MIRLTRAGEYAVRGMAYLATRPKDSLTLIPDIANAQRVSSSFLAKIFQGLSKAGLVESQRGATGGVSLARDASEINLRDVIEAVEGPMALNQCLASENPCENVKTCPLSPVWREAQMKLLSVLEGFTLDRVNGRSCPESQGESLPM